MKILRGSRQLEWWAVRGIRLELIASLTTLPLYLGTTVRTQVARQPPYCNHKTVSHGQPVSTGKLQTLLHIYTFVVYGKYC